MAADEKKTDEELDFMYSRKVLNPDSYFLDIHIMAGTSLRDETRKGKVWLEMGRHSITI